MRVYNAQYLYVNKLNICNIIEHFQSLIKSRCTITTISKDYASL